MRVSDLTTEKFILFAAKHYENPSCASMKEFENDLKRIKYIKRLLRRYKKTGELSERLILNHIILLHNMFNDAIVPMLFVKFEEEYWSQLKTFLVFLNYLPESYQLTDTINEIDIPLDILVVNKLRKI